MKTSKKMQALVTQLAQRHGLELDAVGQRLHLDQEGEFPLIIEVVDTDQISVGQYYETQKEICIPVLQVLFFTGADEWVPLEYVALTRQVYAFLTPQGLGWRVDADPIVNMVERWADELAEGTWLVPGAQDDAREEEADDASG